MERKFVNVILLGFGFMFVFTAFQTMGNIEKTILDSIAHDDPTFLGDGYTSLAIIYATLAVCNWLAPSVISVTGPRGAMLIGAVTYLMFIASFLIPRTWLLYAASVLIGGGAALIWTGQGNYLTLNSDPHTISRNSGVFWAMLQCSMFFGNLFVFIKFQGKTTIDAESRRFVFLGLTGVAVLGLAFLLLLRRARPEPLPEEKEEDGKVAVRVVSAGTGPGQALRGAGRLFLSRDMLLLSLTFIYTGVELSFFSGVYSSCLGFSLDFGEQAKQLVGLSGVFVGLGEVLGGALFGILGGRGTGRWGRSPVVCAGLGLHVVAFGLALVLVPAASPLGPASGSLLGPSAGLAMTTSFLLGLGDACYNTQIYSLLGEHYADDSTSAFAIFKFTQSMAAAACFLYSSHVLLPVQLGVLLLLAAGGSATFCRVETRGRRERAPHSH